MKRYRPFSLITGGAALVFLLAAAWLAVAEAGAASEPPTLLPPGSVVAGVPVGGLARDAAAARVAAVYLSPVELKYPHASESSLIQANPVELGLELDFDAMLRGVEPGGARGGAEAAWQRLWNLPGANGGSAPLAAKVNETRLRAYLQEQVARRYDQPAVSPAPLGGVNYRAGQGGWRLDVEAALPLVSAALRSPDQRRVVLPVETVDVPAALPLSTIQTMLDLLIRRSGFDGLANIALVDLRSNQRATFALQYGKPVDPQIAFTAASTIKIPIMLSVLRRTSGEPTKSLLDLFSGMVVASENPPADRLMTSYLDLRRGPLIVTEDLQELGLKNTFLGGYFYTGAPLLQRYLTPANSQAVIDLRPDIYNQTTPADMASILAWTYQCAAQDAGPLRQVWKDELTRAECQLVLDMLSRNKTALMLEAGVPEGTRVAHKHGWIEEADGLLHTMSDVGVIYTPGGDFVLCIFLYHPSQINFDMTNRLVAYLTTAVYNAFNFNAQYPWVFDPPVFSTGGR
jgi:hypothetical protein